MTQKLTAHTVSPEHQSLSPTIHDHLKCQLQRKPTPLASVGTYTHMYIPTQRQAYRHSLNYLKIKKNHLL